MTEYVQRKTNSDPDVRFRVSQATGWNAERDLKISLILAGANPGKMPAHDGFYAVSYHTSMNSGYACQNKIRKQYPDLETHVHGVKDREWKAEIHVKVRTEHDG